MFHKDDSQVYVSLIDALKKLNEESVILQEHLSCNRRKKNFGKYLTHFDLKRLICRLQIYLYERKNKKNRQIDLSLNSKPNYFSNHKIAIYTGIYGAYDNICEPLFVPDNCDFIIFTDQQIDSNSAWKKRNVQDDLFNKMNNLQKNRYVKMNPHKILEDYDYSVYIDGSVFAVADFTEFINRIGKYGFSMHMHSSRNCVYDELNAAKVYKKINNEMLNTYYKVFKDQKMPFEYGMLECGVIARKHKNQLCIDIMEQWWDYYCRYGGRDQLWLPLVLFKNKIVVQDVSQLGRDIYNNYAFRILQHNS